MTQSESARSEATTPANASPPAPAYHQGTPPGVEVSFEFFPPSTPELEQRLWSAIDRLAPLAPRFVSVTYGAGGSTRDRTHATLERIKAETTLCPAAHLTCVGASRAEVDAVVHRYRAADIQHIVALRGDLPESDDGDSTALTDGQYRNALELVAGIKQQAPELEISVAAYPETHPQAASPQADIDNLKRKIDAGANRAITQFFFDNEHYFRFIDRARAAGIDVPIVPGILPVTNFKTVARFAAQCGATVPDWFAGTFDGLDQDQKTRQLVAASVAIEQCTALRAQGVSEFHFYTLNRAELTRSICHVLGVRPRTPQTSEHGPVSSAA